MKVRNRTHWRTDHIRAFLLRIAKDELEGHWAGAKGIHVDVVYTRPGRNRAGYSSGCATIGGVCMMIRIAKETPDLIDFAHVIAHEMAHLRGVRHNAMRDYSRYMRVGNWRELYAWAKEMPLERKRIKPKLNKADSRQKRAEDLLATWERKLKLARTKVRLYQRKTIYYARHSELKIAAETVPNVRHSALSGASTVVGGGGT